MKTISTEILAEGSVHLGEEAGKLEIYGGLQTPISNDVIVMADKHKAQIENYALRCAQAYGDKDGNKEPTYAQSKRGVPTLVARVDCTIRDNGDIFAYEMEDSPSGQGITDTIISVVSGKSIRQTILDHYEDQVSTIPHVLVSGHRTHGTDDSIIVGASRYSYPAKRPSDDSLVIAKAIPGVEQTHVEFLDLQSRALAPLAIEGDKSYAERSGELVPITNESELLRDQDGELISQVIKRRLGSMAMGVSIFLSNEDKKLLGKHGVASLRLSYDLS